jgi:ribosomal protein S10
MRTLTPLIHKEIDQRMDEIVELAEKTLKETGVYGKTCERCEEWTTEKKCHKCNRKTKDVLQRAQLSNLLSLANETDSVKALELFIKYQMGREKVGRGWTYPEGKPFGDRVIQDFQTLDKWAEEIAKKSGSSQEEIHLWQKETHLWLIRLYVGSLNRWFVALKGAEEGREEE